MAKEKIRIRIKSYDHVLVDKSAEKIVETAKRTGARVSGPIPLPTEKEVVTILRAVHKYKDSRVLPLYEKKRLMEIQELYITRLHQNHWGKTLLDAMADWDVDASHTDIIGIEDE